LTELPVNPEPCATCPYRKDVPSGIWHKTEYEKLREYDNLENPALALFLCHQSPDRACKGWVMQDCIAVRLAVIWGELNPATCFSEPKVPLYRTGNEAADAGERGISKPNKEARKAIDKLRKQRRRRKSTSEQEKD